MIFIGRTVDDTFMFTINQTFTLITLIVLNFASLIAPNKKLELQKTLSKLILLLTPFLTRIVCLIFDPVRFKKTNHLSLDKKINDLHLFKIFFFPQYYYN